MVSRITLLLLLVGLLPAAGIQAALERIEEAYEGELFQGELPTHENGQVRLTPCSQCPSVTLPVVARTRYLLGNGTEDVTLKAFRETAAAVVNPREVPVYVIYDTATREVTRLILDLRDR